MAFSVLLGAVTHLHAFEITSPEIIPITATVDIPFQGNPLTTSTKVGNDQWRFASTFVVPAGWAINSRTGVISGTPTAAMVGTFRIRVAADNYNYSPTYASKVLQLTVSKNSSLAFSPVAGFSDAVCQIAYHGPSLSANKTGVTYGLLRPPSPINWTIVAATGSISGLPLLAQVGTTLTFTVIAQKDGYEPAVRDFRFNVESALDFAGDPVFPVATYDVLYTGPAQSANKTGVTWSLSNAPSGWSIDANTGVISGSPALAKIGSTVDLNVVVAKSGYGQKSKTVHISVQKNHSLIITGPSSFGQIEVGWWFNYLPPGLTANKGSGVTWTFDPAFVKTLDDWADNAKESRFSSGLIGGAWFTPFPWLFRYAGGNELNLSIIAKKDGYDDSPVKIIPIYLTCFQKDLHINGDEIDEWGTQIDKEYPVVQLIDDRSYSYDFSLRNFFGQRLTSDLGYQHTINYSIEVSNPAFSSYWSIDRNGQLFKQGSPTDGDCTITINAIFPPEYHIPEVKWSTKRRFHVSQAENG